MFSQVSPTHINLWKPSLTFQLSSITSLSNVFLQSNITDQGYMHHFNLTYIITSDKNLIQSKKHFIVFFFSLSTSLSKHVLLLKEKVSSIIFNDFLHLLSQVSLFFFFFSSSMIWMSRWWLYLLGFLWRKTAAIVIRWLIVMENTTGWWFSILNWF